MEYKESVIIVELKDEIKQLKADITHLQQENKEIRQILSTLINQNAVELSQIHTQKDKSNATTTQHGLPAGFTGQASNGASELTELRFNALHSKQNSSGNRRDDGGHSTLLARALADISAERENGQSHSSDRERNRAESRSETQSRESGAGVANQQEISRRSGAISQTGKDIETIYRKSLKCTELEKAEFSRLFVKFRQLNAESGIDIEKKHNDTISKIIKDYKAKKPYVYAAQLENFTQETMKRIKKEAFFLEIQGFAINPQNTKAIKDLLLLTRGQDRAMS